MQRPKYLRHHKGTYYYVEPTTRRWHNLGHDQEQALKQYRKWVGLPPQGGVEQLIERYLSTVTVTKAAKTQQEERRHAKLLIKVFGAGAPDDILPKHIGAYLDERARVGAPVAANREIAFLSHVFKKGIRWGVCERNPCLGVERNRETPRTRFVRPSELLAFRAFCTDWLKDYIDLKLMTGLRQQDLLALTTENLTDEGILVQPAKTHRSTGQRTLYVWTDGLHCTVSRLVDRSGERGRYLFRTRAGRRYTASGFQSIWRRRMDQFVAAGGERFTEHDLRAVAVSEADAQGLDSRALSGHASEQAHRVYLRHRVPKRAVPVTYEKS